MDKTITKEEQDKIIDKVWLVEQAGHGDVIIKITDGKVVYISHSIGEQIKQNQ